MQTRPNIVILMADDHRFGAMGSGIETQVITPYLDALAREGTSFERTYTMGGLTGAVCVPSRACLMTGSGAFDAVCSRRIDDIVGLRRLRPDLETLPQVFRNAGYLTHGIGKWHNDKESFSRSFSSGEAIFFGGMGDHFRLPLHAFDPTGVYASPGGALSGRHATDVFADAGVQFLDRQEANSPFLLFIAFTAPHDPRTAPGSFAEMYRPERLDTSIFPNLYAEHPFDNGDLEVRDEKLAPLPRTLPETRRHLADYYAMTSHMDAGIGAILECLDRNGMAEDTIVLYLSDHGLALGQHGLMGKQNMYEHSLRIPCVWRGPGIPANSRDQRLAQHSDVLPTLCKLANVSAPSEAQGMDLFAEAASESLSSRPAILAAYKNQQRCVIEDRFKLVQYFRSGLEGTEMFFEQLFDLAADPYEVDNRAFNPDHAEVLTRLRRNMRDLRVSSNDPYLD